MKNSAKKIELASVDDLFSTEEGRQDAKLEKIQEIPLSELHPFKNHPFKVKDDEAMMETADSIKQYGVLVPAIARPAPEGGYELVAGHRRHRASELAEKETIPVIVRDLDDDAATIIMVDSNLQRESLLPSERAFAYKMKLEAVKHQGARTDLISRQVGEKSQTSIQKVADVVKRDAPHPQSPDRKISMTFIPEGDLYRLIVHSKLPSAERFERWVFDEVLPTIRKHGAYLTKEKLWEVATSPEALMKLCSDLLAEREANISLRKENAQLGGKAAFYDLFIDLKHSTNLRTTAKELDVPERRFVRFLIERRFVYRTASGNVLPYANVKNAGLFCVKDYCNHGHTGSYTLVTPQGKLYFAQLREMILLVS